MVSCEVNIRNEFFISALFVENMISEYLNEKIKINYFTDSSYSEEDVHSVDFYEKMGILMESDKFSIIDKSKLSVFREIHKELSVKLDADTLEDCLTSKASNDDFLLILYPQGQEITREEKLINACIFLIDDVSQLISNYTKKKEVKLFRNLIKINSNLINAFSVFFSILLFR